MKYTRTMLGILLMIAYEYIEKVEHFVKNKLFIVTLRIQYVHSFS